MQETVVAEEADSPVTASQLQRILLENLRPRERPTLEAAPRTSPGPEDRMIIDYLQDWPTKEEAEAAIGELKQLPPFCLALLTRYGITEVEQRMQGESVGLLTREPKLGITERLLEEGLLKPHGDRLALTERGRELARVLPVGKKTAEPPSWFDETLKATAVG